MRIQYYRGGIRSNTPAGFVQFKDFLASISNPKDTTVNLIDMIADASSKGNKKLKTTLKEKLIFVTPAVVVSEFRRYDSIVKFTGLAQIDIDGVDKATEIRDYLFDNYPQLYVAYVSPSGTGVKGIMRIPICESVEEYQEYYSGIAEELEEIDGFDPSPRNAVLPLFVSYDYFARTREEPEIWEKRGRKKQPKPAILLPRVPYRSLKSNEKNERRAIATFRKMVRGILDSPGHPVLRSACLIFGTRCGAGYVNEHEARSIIEYEVLSNSYLAKGQKGYLATAEWAFTEGMRTPKYY